MHILSLKIIDFLKYFYHTSYFFSKNTKLNIKKTKISDSMSIIFEKIMPNSILLKLIINVIFISMILLKIFKIITIHSDRFKKNVINYIYYEN